jgi:hypothetical protein
MPRGGKRTGAGRKPKVVEVTGQATPPPLPHTRDGYDRLIQVLNAPPVKDEDKKDPEAAGWRVSWDSPHAATRLHTRMFLYRMRDGDPPRTINHLHDKPLELTGNLTFSIKDELREARERALKR